MNKESIDYQYSEILKDILDNGVDKMDRTGVGTRSITGSFIKYDMNNGFPILWGKRIAFKTLSVELEGFLKAITDKQWYQDRNCHIWDEWARPNPEWKTLSSEDRKAKQLESRDLGPIYGFQWRNFNGVYQGIKNSGECGTTGIDQVQNIINELTYNPISRRMVVTALNPNQVKDMALDPCHYSWQVVVRGEFLDLSWTQRSIDVGLGLGFNITSYGLLLSLLSHQFNYKPGYLVGGLLGDTHIYSNHFNQIDEYLNRVEALLNKDLYEYPVRLKISPEFKTILEFDHSMVSLENYTPMPAIKAPVAV